ADDECPCDPLPMLDAKWEIQNGVPAQIGVVGACENPAHYVSFWAANYPDSSQPRPSPTDFATTRTVKVSCHAGIWLITIPGNPAVGGQITNATCSPAKIGELSNLGTDDPCITQGFPDETSLDKEGVCPRDQRQLVIRAINESLARVTFEIDPNHVLTFDTARNMWMLEYKYTGVKHWLVAVSCATVGNEKLSSECMCEDLPMLDAKHVIENGVTAQVGVTQSGRDVTTGACANKAHRFTFWAANYPYSIQTAAGNTFSFVDTA
ncbi:hypothetical protein PMAYCL1PPCAC_08058, partial [Pristionchus mayeri]